ncbi:hypothetical protein Droror1_Dr00012268 [Drosera rotundifolia]
MGLWVYRVRSVFDPRSGAFCWLQLVVHGCCYSSSSNHRPWLFIIESAELGCLESVALLLSLSWIQYFFLDNPFAESLLVERLCSTSLKVSGVIKESIVVDSLVLLLALLEECWFVAYTTNWTEVLGYFLRSSIGASRCPNSLSTWLLPQPPPTSAPSSGAALPQSRSLSLSHSGCLPSRSLVVASELGSQILGGDVRIWWLSPRTCCQPLSPLATSSPASCATANRNGTTSLAKK